MKKSLSVLSFIILCSWTSRAQKLFSYKDIYGNVFYISNLEKLPAKIDTVFLKSYLTGKIFHLDTTGRIYPLETFSDTGKHIVTNVEIIQITKHDYHLRLHKSPQTPDVMEIRKNSGHLLYEMRVKYKKGKAYLTNFLFIGGEI